MGLSSYDRPTRNSSSSSSTTTAANQSDAGILSAFFRSMMPGFDPQEVANQHPLDRPAAGEEEPEEPVEGAGANLQRNVTTLVNAMRDLLGSIHLPDLGQPEEEQEADVDSE